MSGPWEKYQAAPQAGPWEKYAPAQPAEPSIADQIGGGIRDLAAGAIRGAGSIGATILAPLDAAARAVGVENSIIGRTDRREAMTGALGEMGADTESLAFAGGKLAGEIAGTAGAGGAIAKGLTAIPGVANAAPGVVNAIRTAGMEGGGAGVANAATRALGGGVTGAVSAGMVDPGQADDGALIGAALPGVLKVAGAAGKQVGKVLRGPEQAPDMAAAIQSARQQGYVIPPTQANPTLGNRLLEGFSGKITTAQNASAKNQAVTNGLAAKAIGLPADTKITPDVLKTVRDAAGQAYQAIGGTGSVTPGAAYAKALDAIEAPFKVAAQGFPNAKPSPVVDLVESLRSPSFDAAAAVEKIKALRTAADDAFRTGNTDVARASRAGAIALEDALETHLQQIGQVPLLKEFRDARKLIAKTYSVEKALNPTTGAVDAKKLASQLARGKPLSGELKGAADFASRFPKAAQTIEGMGSLPQTSPLDWAVGGSLSAATANPLAMLGVAARPAARAMTLSDLVQNRLVQGAPIGQLGQSRSLREIVYRGSPVAATSGSP